ncbi:MAG: glycosyltransferase family 4 protein [Bacillota bacterium]
MITNENEERVKRILWLVNIPLPEASFLMNKKGTSFGGWILGLSKDILKHNQLELIIAFPEISLDHTIELKGEKIKYYAFPSIKRVIAKDNIHNKHIEKIVHDVRPDIVHIFGTEYAHAFEMVKVCTNENIKVIISIQGLISVIAKHYMASLPAEVRNAFTFRDFVKQDNLRQQQKKLFKRGLLEIKTLQKVNCVIGRTTWDKACSTHINPKLQYHFCNETLRDEFYKHIWDIDKCEIHSIFVSQGSYPIKGLHLMIEAMPLILKLYPDTKLYIAGTDITKTDTLKAKLKMGSYGRYIKKIIKKNNLENHIIFTGLLDEKQMCERYLKSNVFVSPSAIENSPNSLGEAMILGVPCVASCVGGVQDMLIDREEGFIYPYDESYMLAHYICELFKDKELALKFSRNAREHALRTHAREENSNKLIQIYRTL